MDRIREILRHWRSRAAQERFPVSRCAMTFESLLDEVASHFPVLWCVSEHACELGVLRPHLADVVTHVLAFASHHGLALHIEVGSSSLLVKGTGLSARQLWTLTGASRTRVALTSGAHTVLDFELFVYRKRGEIWEHRGDVLMETLPRAVSHHERGDRAALGDRALGRAGPRSATDRLRLHLGRR